MSSLFFQIASIFYIALISIVYFFKKKMNTLENKIYSSLIVIVIITLVFDVFSVLLGILLPDWLGTNMICKLYLVSLLTWIFTFTYYIFVISSNKNSGHVLIEDNENYSYFKKVFFCFLYALIGISLLIMIAPLHVFSDGKIMYTYGPSAILSYVFAGVCIVFWAICIIYNKKKISDKRYIPVFSFIILAGVAAAIQSSFPECLLVTSAAVFITILTYFTIENPDMRMIEQLELAREQAEKANRAKTDFLSSMSHEIRTPLNAIVGFSDCITNSQTLEEAKDNAKDIINASNTLLEIVNGILDISKIEAGKLEIVNSSYRAVDIFTELAKLITPKMNEKGLDFSYYIAPDLPTTLYGDHANLKKVVTNLLSNACKYTDKGFVRYEVNCINTKDACKLIISVEDSGRGIKPENVDKLFTKFQRLDEDRNTTIEGTGLGLAITKQLVELMGGRIIVHTVYGEGSKFTVVLNQRIEKEDTLEEPKRIRTTLDLSKEKILVVDDNILNLKVANKLLERYHAENVISIDSGIECLERIKSGEKYDVILLDDMMPKMNGVKTLKELKKIPGFHTPVVALTANAITGMREKYLADGFDDYLAKPIDKDQLIQVMNEVLGKEPTAQLNVIYQNPKEEDEEIEVICADGTLVKDDSEDLEIKYLEENGINVEKAVELLGDMESYQEMLQDFVRESQEKWEQLQLYQKEGDMENYSISVHALKSNSKYLGFTKLAELAYDHEMKSKENDIAYVDEHFAELDSVYHDIISIVEKYLQTKGE